MTEVAFGCAVSRNRQVASVVAAGRHESGRILVDLSPFWGHPLRGTTAVPGEFGVVARLDQLYMKHDPVAVALDPVSHTATLIKPLAERGIIVTKLTAEDVAVAHGEFMDLVNDTRLIHLEQEPLTKAVRAAQERPLAGAEALESRKVAVDQSPLLAAEAAVWALQRWEEVSKPSVWAI